MINFCVLLYYIHMTTYNWINEKHLHVPIIHFYILVWFNIQQYFHTILSGRVYNSGQYVNCTRKYCTKTNCLNIHTSTQTCFTRHRTHHTHLHTQKIKIGRNICAGLSAATKNVVQNKLSKYILLTTCTLHTSLCTSIYHNISAPVLVN